MSVMPPPMANDLDTGLINTKLNCMLSGYGASYIPEWESIYVRTLDYICELYNVRASKYDELEVFMETI